MPSDRQWEVMMKTRIVGVMHRRPAFSPDVLSMAERCRLFKNIVDRLGLHRRLIFLVSNTVLALCIVYMPLTFFQFSLYSFNRLFVYLPLPTAKAVAVDIIRG